MAPESLLDRVYSAKTDTWAFSICCMEILTQKEPYPDMDVVTAATKVTHGMRMTIPKDTNEEFASLLASCWSKEPDMRPDFTQICAVLEGIHKLDL